MYWIYTRTLVSSRNGRIRTTHLLKAYRNDRTGMFTHSAIAFLLAFFSYLSSSSTPSSVLHVPLYHVFIGHALRKCTHFIHAFMVMIAVFLVVVISATAVVSFVLFYCIWHFI